jgi:hypothetical protein
MPASRCLTRSSSLDRYPELPAKKVAARSASRPAPPELRHLKRVGLDEAAECRYLGIDAVTWDVAVFADDLNFEPNVLAILGEAYHDPSVIGETGKIVEPPAIGSAGNSRSSVGCFSSAARRGRSRASDTPGTRRTSTGRQVSR